MKRVSPIVKAHLIRGAVYVFLLLAICAVPFALARQTADKHNLLAFFRPEAPVKPSARTLTFAQRVACQRAIEEVYWRHRIWPTTRPDPKPPLDAVMSQAQLEKKVTDYLRNSQALQDYWQQPISSEQLQAEMDRMAEHTKQPEVLRELFEALGNDPFVIAECLAKSVVSHRLFESAIPSNHVSRVVGQPFDSRRIDRALFSGYTLPRIANASKQEGTCLDTWTPTSLTNAPDARVNHTAVWTGNEMIVWGELAASLSILTPAADTTPAPTVGQLPASPTRPVPEPFTRQCGLGAK